MSLSALERSLRATHPRCVRVNLRLWYALKSANLIAQREVSPAASSLAGVLFPHFGEVLLVLDPELEGRSFMVGQAAQETVPVAVQPGNTAPKAAAPPQEALPESPFDRRWMGRY
ncbi:MAG: hypothetical protein KJ677_03395 [Gammaproteobacteria bacterium]|nr:hypothetical protein [Gammaproteobacteria bacterium]